MSKKTQIDYVRTQVRIPKNLHAEIKIYADKLNMSMNSYIEDAIHGLVERENYREEMASKESLLNIINNRLSRLPQEDLEIVYKLCSRLNFYRGDMPPFDD